MGATWESAGDSATPNTNNMKALALLLFSLVVLTHQKATGRKANTKVWHLAALGGDAASCGKDEAVPTISMVDAVPSSACTQAGEDLCFCETKDDPEAQTAEWSYKCGVCSLQWKPTITDEMRLVRSAARKAKNKKQKQMKMKNKKNKSKKDKKDKKGRTSKQMKNKKKNKNGRNEKTKAKNNKNKNKKIKEKKNKSKNNKDKHKKNKESKVVLKMF